MNEKINLFISLYNSLSQSYLPNPDEVTTTLENLYMELDTIFTLFSIFSISENKTILKSVCFGIKKCIENTAGRVDDEYYMNIWKKSIDVLEKMNDKEIIDCFLLSTEMLFKMIGGMFEFLEALIDYLIERNEIMKCLMIISKLFKVFNKESLNSHIVKLINLLSIAVKSSENLCFVRYIYGLYFNLNSILMEYNNNESLNFQNEFIKPLSDIFINCLKANNQEFFYEAYNGLSNGCNQNNIFPLIFQEVLPIAILFLESSEKDLFSKLYLIDFIGELIENKSINIDQESTCNLLDLGLNFSILAFENIHFEDDEEPTSILTTGIITNALDRIKTEYLGKIIEDRFLTLADQERKSFYYTSLLLIQSAFSVLNVCKFNGILNDMRENIFNVCISGFSIPCYSIKDIASETFILYKYALEPLINDNLQELMSLILDLFVNGSFPQANDLILNILDIIPSSDPVFLIVYNNYSKYFLNNKDVQSTIIVTEIFTSLVKNSETVLRSFFDSIYHFSLEFVKSNDVHISLFKAEAFQCICALSRSCSDLLIEKLPEIEPILFEFYNSNDHSLRQSAIITFIYFFKYFDKSITEHFVPLILPRLFNVCTKDYDHEFIYQNKSDKKFIKEFIVSNFNLLSTTCKLFPNYALNNFENVLKSYYQGISSIFINIASSSLQLLRTIISITQEQKEICFNEFLDITNNLICLLQKEEADQFIIELAKTIKEFIHVYNIDIINGKDIEVFDISLCIIEKQRNVYTDEFVFKEKLHTSIMLLLKEIIYYTNLPFEWINQFIPRLLIFYDTHIKPLQSMTVFIFSDVVQKGLSLNEELLQKLVIDSIKYLSEEPPIYAKSSCVYLNSLSTKYPTMLLNYGQQIIPIIINRSLEPVKDENDLDFIENLLSLFASFDQIASITDEKIMFWFIKFLPFKCAKELNTNGYLFILRHFNEFKNTSIRYDLAKVIFEVFSIQPMYELLISSRVLTQLYKIVISLLNEFSESQIQKMFESENKYNLFVESIKILQGYSN